MVQMRPHPFALTSPGDKRVFQQDIEEVSIQSKDFESISADSLSGFDMASIQPHENDVLMGRGGKNNQHSGNEKLREIARIHCEEYRLSTKKGKSQISRNLVQYMRDLDPPARYVQACAWRASKIMMERYSDKRIP